jgi:O-antigen ligase
LTTRRRPTQSPPSSAQLSIWERGLAALVLAGTVLTPLVMSWNGADHFRLPKQLLLIALAIVCTGVVGAGLVLRRIEWPRDLRVPVAIAGGGLTWAVASTIASSNRALSLQALVWGASVAVLFLIMAVALRRVRPVLLAAAMFVPGVANAILLLLQASRVWNPWTFEEGMPERLMRNALLGNPNDVGAYLAVVTLFAVAMFAASRRWYYLPVIAITGAALLATETLTAIAALTVALMAMLIVARPRLGTLVALIAPPVLLAVLLLYPPTHARLRTLQTSVRANAWGQVMSGRLPAFLVAWEIFRDHPLLGAGPGTYKFHYVPYYAKVEQQYPRAVIDVAEGGTIFAQTHNDHLQLLAEIGLPGYLLVTLGMAVLAVRGSRRSTGLARLLSVPTATLLLVLMLASFPLQLAAPVWACLALGGASHAWRDVDAA